VKTVMWRILALTLLVVILIGTLCGCGAKSDIDKTLSSFESACHSLDVRGVIECLDPALSDPVLTVLDLIGVDDTSGALDALVDKLNVFGNAGVSTEEFMESLKIKADEYEFSDDKTACDVRAEFQYGTGEEPHTMDVTIHMIKVDDGWYISSIR